jgi:multidrug efflux pump subunit AcrA (membrane-fusion protein)
MRGSRTTLRRVLSLALVAAACSLMLAACGREAETEAAPSPHPIRTTTVEKPETSMPQTFTSRIEAEDEVSIAFRISGRLLANDTEIGDRVEASWM